MMSNKITVIGKSGSGKTCYLYSAFGVMQTGNYDHSESNTMPFILEPVYRVFPVKPQEQNDGIEDISESEAGKLSALLNNGWKKMRGAGIDRFPSASSVTVKYGFQLTYDANVAVEFEWIDYKGSILKWFEESDDEIDYSVFGEQLKDSSALFCCISGEYLRDSLGEEITEILGDMNRLITKANSGGNLKKPFPIVILITKSDLCSFHNANNEVEIIFEKIQKDFPLLFSDNWRVMICPVTLGDDLATNEYNAKIRPKNVFLPLAYALYHCLENQIERMENKLKNNTYEVEFDNHIAEITKQVTNSKSRLKAIESFDAFSYERITSWISGELDKLKNEIDSGRSKIKNLEDKKKEMNEKFALDRDALTLNKTYKDRLAFELIFGTSGRNVKIFQNGKEFNIELPKNIT